MRVIADLIEVIDEELEGAKRYAEMYVEAKSNNDMNWSNKFKEMANNELQHALNIHDYTIQKIDAIKRVYTAPVEMQEKWDIEHKRYIEKTGWIKQMLSM